MVIYKSQTIGKIPIIKVRDLLRKGRVDYIFFEDIVSDFKMNKKQAEIFLIVLEREGYLEKLDYCDVWSNTCLGDLLAGALIRRTIRKEKVEQKIALVLKRVKMVNKSAKYLCKILEVYSFLLYSPHNTEEVETILLMAKMEPKETDNSKFNKLREIKNRKSGRNFSNNVEWLFYPKREVMDFLKSRVHNLQVDEISKYRDFTMYTENLIFSLEK